MRRRRVVTVASIRVALLGCGTVGGAVAAALCDPATSAGLADAIGAPIELVGIAVADATKARAGIPDSLIVSDADALVAGGGADVVVELIGNGVDALALVTAALDAGASVVTANKALLATHLSALTARAAQRGVDLYYEAAVAGAIPIVRVLRTSLAGQRLTRVLGIVNGTTNFVLTTMEHERRDYQEVLDEAIARGFAETDPTSDVEGHDAAQKAAILASLGFGRAVLDADVAREGISKVTAADLEAASRMGYVVRLLAVAERVGPESISVRVHPAMVPKDHPLAAVDGASNAVFVEGDASGPVMLQGAGAGGAATASAVLGDLVTAGRNRVAGTAERAPSLDGTCRLVEPGETTSAFYLALEVLDQPGVLAAVATVFGSHGVSIESMEQIGRAAAARLVFLTHPASESQMAATVRQLRELEAVTAIGALLRVVDGPGR
jgi:homoserine dehydrogenase